MTVSFEKAKARDIKSYLNKLRKKMEKAVLKNIDLRKVGVSDCFSKNFSSWCADSLKDIVDSAEGKVHHLELINAVVNEKKKIKIIISIFSSLILTLVFIFFLELFRIVASDEDQSTIKA